MSMVSAANLIDSPKLCRQRDRLFHDGADDVSIGSRSHHRLVYLVLCHFSVFSSHCYDVSYCSQHCQYELFYSSCDISFVVIMWMGLSM